MTAETNGAQAVLRRAAENERQGYYFYRGAIARSSDERGKKMFESLGHDETRHMRLLLVELRALEQGEGWVDPEEAMAREIEIDMSQPLFEGDQMTEVAFPWDEAGAQDWSELQTDLAVLEFGMGMEERFYEMYKSALADVGEESTESRAFSFLMNEENRHFMLLQEAYNYLDENEVWWDDWERPFFEGG